MGEAPWRQYQCSRRAGRLHLTIAIIACLDVAMWITWLWDIIVCCHPKFVMGAHQSFFCRQIWMRIMHLCWKPNEGGWWKGCSWQTKSHQTAIVQTLTFNPLPCFAGVSSCWWSVITFSDIRVNTEHWTVYPSYLSFLLHLNMYIYELRPKGTVRPRYPGTTPII